MSEDRKGNSGKKDGIKPSQVLAAALAAVTAAFLGSTLGVGGTVAGAGIASVVSTVGGELYLRSLRKTKEAAQRTKEAALALADPNTRAETELLPQVPGQRMGGPNPRWANNGWAGHPNNRPPGAGRPLDGDPTVAIPRLDPRPPVPNTGQLRRRYRLRWPLIIATSVVGFVIAILAITGFEGVTGKSISGDQVTTVGHLWTGGSGQPDKPPTSGDEEKAQPTQSRSPATTPPPSSTDTQQPTTSGSAPSTSAPSSSTPSTSAPKSSAPSTSAPKSTNTSRTPSAPPSIAPGGGNQRPGSEGSAGGN
ncbi:hypothetical protein [Nocardia pseudobrasiliensis]|uniref:Uncharacterized protein n=1 Tax=Nocardia pseudobrasiliensis TaxID=45979 RepID=A0A370IFG1_9NOCA|nr:hypothetical protein [Nocardia pseudobrasiliensis]RDI68194.1 hypothetical protein DFR76_102595 [Nocardia pseudobrasiliensis]